RAASMRWQGRSRGQRSRTACATTATPRRMPFPSSRCAHPPCRQPIGVTRRHLADSPCGAAETARPWDAAPSSPASGRQTLLVEDAMQVTPASIMQQWFDGLWNAGDESTLDRFLAADGVVHGLATPDGEPIRGPQGFAPFYRAF